jgi:sugar phosphate isomerase/epimerase
MSRESGIRIFLDGLSEIREYAAKTGIRVLLEPEPELLIENSTQFGQFFQQLDPAVFGLNFDIGHFFCVGEDPVRLVKELKEVTGHYHLEDIAASRRHAHLIPGSGAIDLPSVLQAILESDYDGFVTVELYPYEDQPIRAARQAYDYVERVL